MSRIKRVNHLFTSALPGDTMETLFENIHPSNIEWPNEDEELDQDAIRLIMSLLEMDPMARLGARGTRMEELQMLDRICLIMLYNPL